MLVNRDSTRAHAVQVLFDDGRRKTGFAGPVTSVSFGSEQYVWINDGPNSHADPDHAPVAALLQGTASTFTLPKASITVLRGRAPRQGVRTTTTR
jgi:hypothetical protein